MYDKNMKKLYVISFLVSVAILTTLAFHFTQKSQISFYKGKNFFERGSYKESLPFLEESLRHSKDNKQAAYLYAEALHYTGDHQGAVKVLKGLLQDEKE